MTGPIAGWLQREYGAWAAVGDDGWLIELADMDGLDVGDTAVLSVTRVIDVEPLSVVDTEVRQALETGDYPER
ncbi:hypothetical protein K7711_02925 [Nocardia sp. CA2R105]|uniref:hypothetical protein n=1 Tax=Nocardia coffeae TaxID=2873381 RepID=UPI001CA6D867|nr:hypothetical protein [Nocardia coffeae]MBY8855421.1 hypothetical protein [Nocardia coffeae]